MKNEMLISDKKIAKLAKRLAKTFGITQEEAMELIYEEWDLVESPFSCAYKSQSSTRASHR